MIDRLKYILLLFFFLSQISGLYAQKLNSVEIKQKAESLLQKRTGQGFSGTVLIAVNDSIILDSAYGFADSSGMFPNTQQTRFNIASISKTITAVGLFKLIGRDLISTEDKISRFFQNVPSDKTEITIHQLLTHTSGLQQHYAAFGESDRDSAIFKILNDTLKFEPGSGFSYSNENYELLATIIEIVTHEPYENFIRENVLKPSDMPLTCFWGEFDDLDPTRFAQKSYEISPEIRKRNWDFIGSGGIYSTSNDLFNFYKAFSSGKLLPSDEIKTMLTPYKDLSSTSVGYGWFISKTDWGATEFWTRGTEDFGHNAVLRWFPDDNVVIIVCSNAGEKLGNYANQVISNDLVSLIYEK